METVKWLMIFCQLAVWGWFSARGGKLADRNFLIFTTGMLLGQIAAGYETYTTKAWGTFVIQVYFFAFTAYGGYRRMKMMRAAQKMLPGSSSETFE